jgi:hypothetical protein
MAANRGLQYRRIREPAAVLSRDRSNCQARGKYIRTPRHRARSQKPDQWRERGFQSNSSAPEHPEHKDRTRYEQHGTQDEQAIAQSSSSNASLLHPPCPSTPAGNRAAQETAHCQVTYDCRESRWNVCQRAQRQSLPGFCPTTHRRA